MDNSSETRSIERQATRLRELMRNRFSQEVSLKLVNEFGGEREALDFLLNENEAVVYQYLHQTPEYLENLRTDSQNLASILENGFESSVRMFGCGSCTRTWWKKVPIRKEVSRCFRCEVKYDPIPRDKEWGWGKFICQCSNEFHGYASMGETVSICFKCETMCPVDHILPPKRRPKWKKSRSPHTCNGINCYNRDADDHDHSHDHDHGQDHDYGHTGQAYYEPGVGGTGNGIYTAPGSGLTRFARSGSQLSVVSAVDSDFSGPAGAYKGPPLPPTCIHPKSNVTRTKKLRHESRRHLSTGSTVTDVMSQGTIDTQSVVSKFAMASILEED